MILNLSSPRRQPQLPPITIQVTRLTTLQPLPLNRSNSPNLSTIILRRTLRRTSILSPQQKGSLTRIKGPDSQTHGTKSAPTQNTSNSNQRRPRRTFLHNTNSRPTNQIMSHTTHRSPHTSHNQTITKMRRPIIRPRQPIRPRHVIRTHRLRIQLRMQSPIQRHHHTSRIRIQNVNRRHTIRNLIITSPLTRTRPRILRQQPFQRPSLIT